METAIGTQETALEEITTPLGVIKTSVEEIRNLLFGNKEVSPTDLEIGLFIKTCAAYGLNPFLKDVHLVKYKSGQPAAIIVGKDSFTKKARQMGARWVAGIVVKRGDKVYHEEGALLLPGDELVGGWATVITGKNERFPDKVSMKEYGSYQSTWKSMPATMIRKVALVHALREAYPDLFGGLYDASEMSQAYPDDDLVKDIDGSETEAAGDHTIQLPTLHDPDAFTAPVELTGVSDTGGYLESEVIDCPLHIGDSLVQKTSKHGPYWSHKASDGWCNLTNTFKPNTTGKAKPFVDAWNSQILKLLVETKSAPEIRDSMKQRIAAANGPEPWADVVKELQAVVNSSDSDDDDIPDDTD